MSSAPRSWPRQVAPFVVNLGALRAFPAPDELGVYAKAQDVDGRYATLRGAMTAPPFDPLDFPPRMTIIHPRTSRSGPEFLRAAPKLEGRLGLAVDAIAVTAFQDDRYDLVEHPLADHLGP